MTGLIQGVGNAGEISIHDIEILQMQSVASGGPTAIIDFGSGGNGSIRHVKCRRFGNMNQDEGFRLDGAWDVKDCDISAALIGIAVEAGEVYIDTTTIRNAAIGVKATRDFGSAVLGSVVYRGVAIPFEDADTDVVNSIFTDVKVNRWIIPGAMVASTPGVERFYFPDRSYIISVDLAADTAGTGSGFAIIDLMKNGVTTFTTPANRPALSAGENWTGRAGPDIRLIAAGEYLTVDQISVNATTPPEDLVVSVRYVEMPAA